MSKGRLSTYQRKNDLEKNSNVFIRLKDFLGFDLFLSVIGVLLAYSELLDRLMPLGVIYFTIFFYYNLKYKGSKKRLAFILGGLLLGYLIDFNYYSIKYLAVVLLMIINKNRFNISSRIKYVLGIGILFLPIQFIQLLFDFKPIVGFNLVIELLITTLSSLLLLKLVPDISIFMENRDKVVTRGVMGIIFFVAILLSGFTEQLILESFYNVNLARMIINYVIMLLALTNGVEIALIFASLFGLISGVLQGNIIFLSGSYSFAVLTASLFKDKGRLGLIASYLLAKLFFISLLNLETLFLTLLFEALIGSLLLMITPEKLINPFSLLIDKGNRSEELEKRKLQNFVGYRIKRFARIFTELYNSFSQVSSHQEQEVENIGTFLDVIVEKVCQNCGLYQSCWRESFYTTYNSLFNLLALAETKGEILVDDLNKIMKSDCTKSVRLTTTINQFIQMYELNTYWKARLKESEDILFQQLSGISEVVNDLAQELEFKVKAEKETEKEIYFLLKYNSIPVKKILVTNYDDKSLEFTIRKRRCNGNNECKKKIIKHLNKKFEQNFALIWSECGYELQNSYCINQYKRANSYQFEAGVAYYSSNDRISGDNYSFFKHRDDKFSAVLSDGMGVGSKAYQESASAVELLKKMLEANSNYKLALKTINKILSLRSKEDKFATIDLLNINRSSGKAEFIKVGSVPSFVKRDGDVKIIKAASLPIGILSRVDYEKHCMQLKDDDLIIMITDGILDSNQNIIIKEEWMINILKNNLLNHPQSLADYILSKAKKDNALEDDMTVLVIKVNKC